MYEQFFIPPLFSLLLAALATWQIVEIFHHGEIFARYNARIELMIELPQVAALSSFWKFVYSVLLCPKCLSVWVGGCTFLSVTFIPFAWVIAGILSTSRLANFFNDWGYSVCRSKHPPQRPSPDQTIPCSNSGIHR
jgi:hypothetical protein